MLQTSTNAHWGRSPASTRANFTSGKAAAFFLTASCCTTDTRSHWVLATKMGIAWAKAPMNSPTRGPGVMRARQDSLTLHLRIHIHAILSLR